MKLPSDPRILFAGAVAAVLGAAYYASQHPASTVGMSDRGQSAQQIAKGAYAKALDAAGTTKDEAKKAADKAAAAASRITPTQLEPPAAAELAARGRRAPASAKTAI